MKKACFWIFSCLMPFSHSFLEGYETKPWLEEDLLPKSSLFAYGDGFSCVPTREQITSIDGWMLGLGASLRVAILGEYALEGELFSSLSNCNDYTFEALRITGRMLLTNDSVGDAFSSTIGATFTVPYNKALRDINRFYYGRYAWELHYALGREYAPSDNWENRSWLVGTVGIANQGSPFLRLRAAWEGAFFLAQSCELFATAEVGLGRRPFPLCASTLSCCPKKFCPKNFPGYAPFRYRFIDMGLIYRRQIEDIGEFFFRYTGRAFGYNLPGNEQSACVGLTIPWPL